MWLKLIGSLFILFAAVSLGFRAAATFAERPGQIRQIISCLNALSSQINYLSSPLPEALTKSSAGVFGSVACLFQDMGSVLSERAWLTPQEALSLSYEKNRENLSLKKTELEVLTVLFAGLGSMDKDEQQKAIALAECQLSRLQEEASKFSAQNVKMYRYLGICGALALIIIFF